MTTRSRSVRGVGTLALTSLIASLASGSAAATGPAAPGDLDVAFGGDGFVELLSPDPTTPELRDTLSATPKNDGGVLIAATTASTEAPGYDVTPFAVELLPDGSYNESFGDGGVVYPYLRGWSDTEDFDISALEAAPLAGGVLVSGTAADRREEVSRDRLWLQRFTRSGRIDRDFAGTGSFRLQALDLTHRVVTVDGDTILVCGDNDRGGRLTVVRLDKTGVGVPGFGVDGVSNTTLPKEHGTVVSCAVTPSGGVVVLQRELHSFWLTRLTAAGALDTGFGDGGFARGAVRSDILLETDGVVQGNGRAFLLGTVDDEQPVVTKRTRSGKPDPAFGGDGYSDVVLEAGTYASLDGSLAVGRRGEVVVAGDDYVQRPGDDRRPYVARLSSDGSMDPTFGDAGLSIIVGPVVTFSDVDLYRDGRILAQAREEISPADWFVRLQG